MTDPTKQPQGPDHSGGGAQGDPVEGSYTDGGSLPGHEGEGRSFGAGRKGNAGGNEDAGDPQTGEVGPPPDQSDAPGGANNGSVQGHG